MINFIIKKLYVFNIGIARNYTNNSAFNKNSIIINDNRNN